MPSVRLEVPDDAAALAETAADRVAAWLSAGVEARGGASLVLSGGGTPIETYRRLARRDIDWRRIDLFWGDERCVTPEDPASNYARARASLLLPAGVPAERVHRIRGELTAREAAADYEDRLRARFTTVRPEFDVLLLGVGSDGHTASLFSSDTGSSDSGSSDSGSESRWVVATRSPEPPHDRVSLGFEALRGAARTVFLVAGAAKAEIVARILEAPDADLPAARVAREAANPIWLLDREAASRIGH